MRAAIPVLMCLVGCVDFAGDWGQLGFASSLVVDGVRAWTPDAAVADDVVATFVATDRLDEDGEQAPDVRGSARGLEVVSAEEQRLTLRGASERGVVRYDGALSDRFTVSFRPPTTLAIVDPLLVHGHAVDPTYPSTFAVIDPIVVEVSVRDRRGRSLGYDRDALVLGGGLSRSDHAIVLTAASEPVTVEVGRTALDGPTVVSVTAADVVGLELDVQAVQADDGERGWLARVVGRTADGLGVYGLQPDWAWEGDGEPIDGGWLYLQRLDGLSATWGEWQVDG